MREGAGAKDVDESMHGSALRAICHAELQVAENKGRYVDMGIWPGSNRDTIIGCGIIVRFGFPSVRIVLNVDM